MHLSSHIGNYQKVDFLSPPGNYGSFYVAVIMHMTIKSHCRCSALPFCRLDSKLLDLRLTLAPAHVMLIADLGNSADGLYLHLEN